MRKREIAYTGEYRKRKLTAVVGKITNFIFFGFSSHPYASAKQAISETFRKVECDSGFAVAHACEQEEGGAKKQRKMELTKRRSKTWHQSTNLAAIREELGSTTAMTDQKSLARFKKKKNP